MSEKILFFTAGPTPTAQELSDIADLNKLTESKYTVGVRNGAVDPLFGAGAESTDYVSGTVPLDGAGEAYENTPVFAPADAAEGFASVTNGQTFDVNNSAESETAEGTAVVTDGALIGANLPASVAIVGDAAALLVPVSGTYIDTATFSVANGVITGIVLS